MTRRIRRRAATVLLLLAPFGLVACGGDSAARWVGDTATPEPTGPPPTLAVTPDQGTSDALLSTEIGTETDGEITDVALVAADGDRIDGALREDGSAWVPERPLTPETEYTATVTATGADGQTAATETTFTTMAAPGQRTDTGLYLFDDREYGVAMPVVVEFVQPVPEEARADVQRRMFVSTDPPQPGVWSWYPSGTVAFYRAPEYWEPGTTLDVRIALDGHPTGNGRYGDVDRSATATIGSRLEMKVKNKAKEMRVYEDGELVKTMPVSLGKASTPSSSGHMVVMSKEESTVFDTFEELGPEEGYRIDIEYAMRLTWGGEFIHSAPWSVGDQGVRNVSHGCVNLAPDNARWLFDKAKVGDPITVSGTERRLEHGNGWTPWELSWEEFIEGSALPVPDELRS
jgi:lipoprotein-anchoring transpeptidase ErfK/SrfK